MRILPAQNNMLLNKLQIQYPSALLLTFGPKNIALFSALVKWKTAVSTSGTSSERWER